MERAAASKRMLTVFLLLSLVSFFADLTYEGARSISGPYLSGLGASLIIVGSLSIGEAISYLARLIAGLLSYRYASPRFYWGMVFAGYIVNLTAVPLLALAGEWEIAFTLYIVERIGKGLRAPTRDAILSEVGSRLGAGKLFGVHELLDQAGAITGALFMAASLESRGVSSAFILLGIPAAMAILLLSFSYTLYPNPRVAAKPQAGFRDTVARSVKLSIPLVLSIAPFVHWATAGSLLSARESMADIALAYALAMAVDALSAIPLGVLYDMVGPRSLIVLPIASVLATLSLLAMHLMLFAALWGLAMAGYETIAKAYIASRTGLGERGIVYGVVYALVGAGWTLGNVFIASII
ncbi:MAG: MFS transporter [Desulfurococcales archaeon]|nr:MFS transporter [Desulfurococcales archaeon]